MIRTFRYRIYPTRRQAQALEDQLGFACDLYNAALEQRRDAWRRGRSVRLRDQQHELTGLRGDYLPMNYVAQEMALQRLSLAFEAFFRRVRQGEAPGFPRYKVRQRYNTLSWRNAKGGATITDVGRLRIQGVGAIRVRWHRDLPSEPKQTRITRRNGRWFVAFAVEVEPDPLPSTGQRVGVDLGVRVFASLSTGEAITGPRAGRLASPAIRRAQRAVARCRQGSGRRRKAVQRLAKRKNCEADRRRDAAHKAARSLVDRFDVIAVEDLRIRNMLHANRGLSREISDQGWRQFLQCLDDKAESAGRQVIRVSPINTSRTCPQCGMVDGDSRRGRWFTCVSCGHSDDADVNAAHNILAAANREIRPGRGQQALTPMAEALPDEAHMEGASQRDQARAAALEGDG